MGFDAAGGEIHGHCDFLNGATRDVVHHDCLALARGQFVQFLGHYSPVDKLLLEFG
ncbi:MAG TPA: hypothetical protein VFV02_17235 [Acidimicrobiales bacterium]|nr:hypothetical protein [Acidimicrobiales bacterium]